MSTDSKAVQSHEAIRAPAKLGALVMIALRTGSLKTIDALFKRSFDPKSVDAQGRTALMVAIGYGHLTLGRRLLELGVDPWAVDRKNMTARDLAIASGDVEGAAMIDTWLADISGGYATDTADKADLPGNGEPAPDAQISHLPEPTKTEARDDPDRQASTDFFGFDTLSWEIDDTQFVPTDGSEIIASVEQTQRDFGVPLLSDGVDWGGINVTLPSLHALQKYGLPRPILRSVSDALSAAREAGVLILGDIRLPGGLTEKQSDALLECVKATAEAAGIIVHSQQEFWPEGQQIPSSNAAAEMPEIDLLMEHFESGWRSRFVPSPVEREIAKMGRLFRDDEEALFARIDASQREAYHDLGTLPQVRKFVLDAHELVMAGSLDFSFVSGAELEQHESAEDEPFDDTEAVEPNVEILELPSAYAEAIAVLQITPDARLAGSAANRAAGALRALELTPAILNWLAESFASDPHVAAALTICQRKLKDADRLREKVLTRHLPLARHVAQGLMAEGLELDDLTQEAALGLMRAIELFDPSLGNRFATYASMWCWQRVQRAIADQQELIRIPVHARGLRLKFLDLVAEVEAGGRPSLLTPEQVEESCGVSPQMARRFFFNQRIDPIEGLERELIDELATNPFDAAAYQDMS